MRVVYLLCGGGKYTNPYNTKEEEPTIYCTPYRHANCYTTEEIYHTPDLLHNSEVKYINRYNTKEDEPTIIVFCMSAWCAVVREFILLCVVTVSVLASTIV
jgi:hypothetical protein